MCAGMIASPLAGMGVRGVGYAAVTCLRLAGLRCCVLGSLSGGRRRYAPRGERSVFSVGD